jgi:hypothetical protein
MKILRFFLLSIAVGAMVFFQNCGSDDPAPDGVVDFAENVVNITTDDLSPVTVDFLIDPKAPAASDFTVALSGADYGTVYTTNPAATNGSVTIPVAVNATSASMTVTFIDDGIGFNSVALNLTLSGTGERMTTGLVTSMTINVANNKDKGEDMPVTETFDGCNDGGDAPISEGWSEYVAQQNAENSAHWGCVDDGFFDFGGAEANAFVAGSDDETTSEVWLVSPRINLVDASSPVMSFDVDRRFGGTGNFDGDLYDIWIATTFTGTNYDEANWTRFVAGFDKMTENTPDEDGMTNTGDLDISAFNGQVIAVAFVYRAGGPGGFDSTILRIDNFSVSDE